MISSEDDVCVNLCETVAGEITIIVTSTITLISLVHDLFVLVSYLLIDTRYTLLHKLP